MTSKKFLQGSLFDIYVYYSLIILFKTDFCNFKSIANRTTTSYSPPNITDNIARIISRKIFVINQLVFLSWKDPLAAIKLNKAK